MKACCLLVRQQKLSTTDTQATDRPLDILLRLEWHCTCSFLPTKNFQYADGWTIDRSRSSGNNVSHDTISRSHAVKSIRTNLVSLNASIKRDELICSRRLEQYDHCGIPTGTRNSLILPLAPMVPKSILKEQSRSRLNGYTARPDHDNIQGNQKQSKINQRCIFGWASQSSINTNLRQSPHQMEFCLLHRQRMFNSYPTQGHARVGTLKHKKMSQSFL